MKEVNKTETIEIRLMRIEDIPQAKEIDRISFSIPWPEKAFEYELKHNPRSLLWVAEITKADGEKQIIGVLVLWLILEEAHIATLSVHPDYRNQGIATQMLRAALERAVRENCTEATLEVRESNVIAQKLYETFGFVVVGRRRKYYKDTNEDALIMTITKLDQDYLKTLENRLQYEA